MKRGPLVISPRFVWQLVPPLGCAWLYALYWYLAVPRESYPSLRIAWHEEFPLWLHVTSAMSALAVASALVASGVAWLRRRLGGYAAGGVAGLCFTLSLLPVLSGQHDLLARYRPWLVLGTALILVATHVAVFRWVELAEQGRLRRFANLPRRRLLGGVAALGCVALWLVTEPLKLYPALLAFLFASAVLWWGLSVESGALPATGSRAHRFGLWVSGLGVLLSVLSVSWVAHAPSFARVRYVFSRRCVGADGLVRLPESLHSEWLRVRAAFTPGGPPADRVRPWPAGTPEPKARPHVVLFVIDALREDHVTPETAPQLMALAARGRRHLRAYSASSGTAQSMVSCLSGLPPGVLARLEVIPPTLPSALRELGYRTAAPWDLHKLRMDGNFTMLAGRTMAALGIDERHDPRGESVAARDRAVVDDALARLASAASPRFEYLHLMQTHGPFKGSSGPQRYREAIGLADENLGRFVTGLERRALLDRTLLFVFGDHGEALGEHDRFGHNQTLYAEETHVPLVIVGPGFEPAIEPGPVSLMEVPSLALGALGLEYPHGARGGRDAPHGRSGFVLLEYKMLDQVAQRALRSSSLSFVRWAFEGTVELFDLERELVERAPARTTPEQRAALSDLERAVEAWEASEIARVEALPRAK